MARLTASGRPRISALTFATTPPTCRPYSIRAMTQPTSHFPPKASAATAYSLISAQTVGLLRHHASPSVWRRRQGGGDRARSARAWPELTYNVALNGDLSVDVVPVAVGASEGTVHFRTFANLGCGHLDEAGDIEVPVKPLQEVLRERDATRVDFNEDRRSRPQRTRCSCLSSTRRPRRCGRSGSWSSIFGRASGRSIASPACWRSATRRWHARDPTPCSSAWG